MNLIIENGPYVNGLIFALAQGSGATTEAVGCAGAKAEAKHPTATQTAGTRCH